MSKQKNRTIESVTTVDAEEVLDEDCGPMSITKLEVCNYLLHNKLI